MPKYGLAVTSRICIPRKKTRPPNATTARTPPSSVMGLLAGCGAFGCMAFLIDPDPPPARRTSLHIYRTARGARPQRADGNGRGQVVDTSLPARRPLRGP